MKTEIYLDKAKRKYKGNLHTHSTRSDGEYSPKRVVDLYKSQGYSFLCLTDHETYFNSKIYNSDDFILLSGYEKACYMRNPKHGYEFHVNGFLDKSLSPKRVLNHDEEVERPYIKKLDEMQGLIDNIISYGNLVVLNHPFWSHNKPEDLAKLKGFVAIEIYNNHHQVQRNECLGYSIEYWDYLLKNGRKVYGIANDDAHFENELFGGWHYVEAQALDVQAIIDAIKSGKFYSSQGPQIFDLRVEDNVINISCSDVEKIKFITCKGESKVISSPYNSPINFGSYNICGNEKYVRIECCDYNYKTAWSNPIFIDTL